MADLDQALSLHRAGRLDEAQAAYARVIAHDPDDPMAHHLLGALVLQRGQAVQALEHFARALALRPGMPEALTNQAVAFRELGQPQRAVECLRQAVESDPAFAPAHYALGNALAAQGDWPGAEQAYHAAAHADPAHLFARAQALRAILNQGQPDRARDHLVQVLPQTASPDALFELGVAAWQCGAGSLAELAFRATLRVLPSHASAAAALGVALKDQGRLDEAIAAYRLSLSARPDHAQTTVWLGNALAQQGHGDEAVICYRRATQLDPNLSDAHNQLGLAHLSRNEVAAAIGALDRAVLADSNNLAALNNLGLALNAAGDHNRAAAVFERALAIKPDFFGALINLGNELGKAGHRARSIEIYERAVALEPDNLQALASLVAEKRHACDWRDLAAQEAKVCHLVGQGHKGAEPFSFLAIDGTRQQQRACAATWGQRLVRGAIRPPPPPSPDGRIRLGYLSSDLHGHATAYLIAEMFEQHDRSRFHLTAYSYGPDEDSPIRRRVKAAFDRFVDIQGASHMQAAQAIMRDQIDILVDLKGFTFTARPQILAARPAPIQVSYLGYPGTMGVEFMDYILADPFVLPMDHQPFYSESIVHLPDCYQCNDSTRAIDPQTPSRQSQGLPKKGFVFCCFNNTYKITPKVFDVWMRLLKKVPGSVLWLLEANAQVRGNLAAQAQARGVDGTRLVFAPRVPLAQHLARHRLADLFLDTLPYNAHTTASDALWAGLPVVTAAGDCFQARVAGSLLTAVGLPELITADLDQYEALALKLARDPKRLKAVKGKLAANLKGARLFDTPRFTRAVETAYQVMVERLRAGRSPQPLVIKG